MVSDVPPIHHLPFTIYPLRIVLICLQRLSICVCCLYGRIVAVSRILFQSHQELRPVNCGMVIAKVTNNIPGNLVDGGPPR